MGAETMALEDEKKASNSNDDSTLSSKIFNCWECIQRCYICIPAVAGAQETMKSLPLRLIDMDVGYSSDEGGEDTHAWFIDGVDCAFSTV
jgi:hypothetical protein